MCSTDTPGGFFASELQHPEMNYGPGVSGELRVTHDFATWQFMVLPESFEGKTRKNMERHL